MLRGIVGPLPPHHRLRAHQPQGEARWSKRRSSRREPADDDSNTILAGWTYGLGKAVAFTSDATPALDRRLARLGQTTTSSSAR